MTLLHSPPAPLAARAAHGLSALLLATATLVAREGLARADEPAPEEAPRSTFRLDYQRLDELSARRCPTMASVRDLARRIFGYDVINDDAGPAISLNVATAHRPSYFEVVSHILRRDNIAGATRIQFSSSSSPDDCLNVLYQSLLAIQQMGEPKLRSLQGKGADAPAPTLEEDPQEGKAKEPIKEPEPAPKAPVLETTPPAPPAPATSTWKSPAGFFLLAGVMISTGLTPTPSLGGVAGLDFRHGSWSEGIEIRVDHGLLPAYMETLPVESLYAGATLVAPCLHEGMFSACAVADAGGFSFSSVTHPALIDGHFSMLGVGLRARLEHRVGEHFILRGFLQFSAIPLSPFLILQSDLHWKVPPSWTSGPGFSTFGLAFVSIP